MVQRNPVRAVPVVVFFILIAGMFSVVLVPVNIEIYGTVMDDEGNPLNNVHMYVYRSDGRGGVTIGGVDSQGRFSVSLHEYGEWEVWAESSSLYWWQGQKVKFDSQDNNLRHRMDFQLIPDIPCNVTLIAQFWSVNTTHTWISFGYAQSGTITTLVEAISPHDPYNTTVDYEMHGSSEGSGYPEGGHILLQQCSISGSYSDTPGSVRSCSVRQDETMGTLGLPAADYLSPENASGGWIEELQPQSYRELKIWPDRNYTLPDALSVPVDVDILGKRFQTILPCTMLAPDSRTLSIWVSVTNLDSVPHSYKFFVEGGHIIHIWEIS